MKLKNIYAIILLAGISLSGCTDFLNQDPRDFISEATTVQRNFLRHDLN